MKVISLFVLVSFMGNLALADCDFSTGITRNEDGSYRYSKECHTKVGVMKQDLQVAQEQLEGYKKAIELKDLALVKTEQRVQLWTDTTFKLEDRITKIDELQSKNNILYFGLGVVFTGLAVWGAGQLR